MKKYIAPEMTVLEFVTDEAMANTLAVGSDTVNDGEFGTWS